jgi:hypothetical protein
MTKSSTRARARERSAFIVRELDHKWCVLERFERGSGLGLVSYWDTREEAREAARQLNREERRR